MKRAVVMLALLLALGLCTSVLVAWAGALVDRDGWPDTLLTRDPAGTRTEVRGWLVEEGRDQTLTWRTFAPLGPFDEPPDAGPGTSLPAWSMGHGLPDMPGIDAPARERSRDMAWELSAGWPLRCVRARRGLGRAIHTLPGQYLHGGLPAIALEWPGHGEPIEPAQQPDIRAWPILEVWAAVPYTPMPLGLLANAAFFGALWACVLLPLATPAALRRRLRRARARCAACGHSVAGLPTGAPCPECGRELDARTPLPERVWPRAAIAGACVALLALCGSSASLATHRWMAIDRLPPLHHAAATGDVASIRRLLDEGADVDATANRPNFFPPWLDPPAALMLAVEGRHRAAVRALLAAGASPKIQGARFQPVNAAFWGGDEAIMEAMLDALPPGPPPAELAGLLPYATDAVRERALAGFEWDPWSLNDAAEEALDAHDPAWFERLVREGLDPGHPESRGLLSAAVLAEVWGRHDPAAHDAALTRRLLALGFDRGPLDVASAVETAIGWGNVPALNVFIERNPVTASILARLHGDAPARSAMEGHAPMVARLLELGVDANARDQDGWTALHHAALQWHADVAAVLLGAGADPTARVDGLTPRELLMDDEWLASDPRAVPVLEMLEAAEAQWHACEEAPNAPDAPGDP